MLQQNSFSLCHGHHGTGGSDGVATGPNRTTQGGAATILVLQLTKTLLLSRVGEAAETQHGKQVWMRYNLNLNTSKQVSAIVS